MRQALIRHALLTVVAAVVLSGLVGLGVWRFAGQDAARAAEREARQVASALLVPMRKQDYLRPGGIDRAYLLDHLAPFLTAGLVERVKVFTVQGDLATIRFSDEPRVEGQSGRLATQLADRLAAGHVIVESVPADAEHRYETGMPGGRMEVFFAFQDASGNDTRLELYVPVDATATAQHATAVLLPMVLAGLLLLAAAMLPLSASLARRLERDRAEQRAVRRYGLAAAELARRDLAQRLHDGVIPDLASAGLLVKTIRTATDEDLARLQMTRAQVLDRVHGVLSDEVRQLRSLLAELVPPDPCGTNLDEALRALVDRVRAASPVVETSVIIAGQPVAALSRTAASVLLGVAGELIRNALRHAAAQTLRITVDHGHHDDEPTVRLTVTDDGVGFDTARSRPPGHIGLQLAQRVVEDHHGTVQLSSRPGTGTTVVVTLPVSRRR